MQQQDRPASATTSTKHLVIQGTAREGQPVNTSQEIVDLSDAGAEEVVITTVRVCKRCGAAVPTEGLSRCRCCTALLCPTCSQIRCRHCHGSVCDDHEERLAPTVVYCRPHYFLHLAAGTVAVLGALAFAALLLLALYRAVG